MKDNRTAWEKHLDKYYCTADPMTGNRPCDNGEPCDACHTSDFMGYVKEIFDDEDEESEV